MKLTIKQCEDESVENIFASLWRQVLTVFSIQSVAALKKRFEYNFFIEIRSALQGSWMQKAVIHSWNLQECQRLDKDAIEPKYIFQNILHLIIFRSFPQKLENQPKETQFIEESKEGEAEKKSKSSSEFRHQKGERVNQFKIIFLKNNSWI